MQEDLAVSRTPENRKRGGGCTPFSPRFAMSKYDRIFLTQGKFTLVDPGDYGWLIQFDWHAKKDPSTGKYYAARNLTTRKGATVQMSREIMGLLKGDSMQVDHISGDTLDNRRSNLRICTNSENAMNRSLQKNNTTGFKGVVFIKNNGRPRYAANIRANGKTIYLGSRRTAKEAFEDLYVPAARIYHGDFARFK